MPSRMATGSEQGAAGVSSERAASSRPSRAGAPCSPGTQALKIRAVVDTVLPRLPPCSPHPCWLRHLPACPAGGQGARFAGAPLLDA